MTNFVVTWAQLKNFIAVKQSSYHHIEKDDQYLIFGSDGVFSVSCQIPKCNPPGEDQLDFETNYKSTSNRKIDAPRDSDGSPLNRVKITTTGWHYQLHGLEFKTSQLDSIYSKKDDATDFGYTTIKCYDENNNQLNSQNQCDTSCVKTVIDWEPNFDYEIVGGFLRLITIPTEDLRLWVVGVPDVPAQYGGSKLFAANVNLRYVGLEEGVKVDGRAPKYLMYSASQHTNKLRLVLRHPVGFKHNLQMIFEIFKA